MGATHTDGSALDLCRRKRLDRGTRVVRKTVSVFEAIRRWFVKPRIESYDAFRQVIESYGYDLTKYKDESVERLWTLYGQRKLDIRKPVQCDYLTSTPEPGWQPSDNGHANVAYMMGRSIPCPRPAIFYGMMWYGGFTSAYKPVQRCLDEIIWTSEYGEHVYGEKDMAVIA